MSKKAVINIEDFDPHKLLFSNINLKSYGSQLVSYPKYDNDNLIINITKLKITQYGIPPLTEYQKMDAQRNFLKLPIDPNQKSCNEIESFFNKIDEFINKNLKNIVGEKLAKFNFKYITSIKGTSEELIDDQEDVYYSHKKKCKKIKYKYWKSSFDLNWETGSIQTEIYVLDENKIPVRVEIGSVTELTEYLRFNSKVKMTIMIEKLWFDKHARDKVRNCGLKSKILKLEINSTKIPLSLREFRESVEQYVFIDENADKKLIKKNENMKEEFTNDNENDLDIFP